MDLQKLLVFIKLTQNFRDVERKVALLKAQRHENDAEHSYQLAITAWYIIDSQKLNLDSGLAIQYALAHDIVEVYAGDTPMNSKDKAYVASKAQREKEAAIQIKQEFPEFEELHHILHDYEARKDEESKFVYALDKLLPPLNIYLEKGHSWKKNEITLTMVIDHKLKKIALSPEIKKYFDELLQILKKEEHELFFQ